MKKIKFLLPLLGLALASAVYAYFGSHEFLSLTTTTDGHLYKSEYRAEGTFPFDGTGVYDSSRVNLKGILTVFEIDGNQANESYCAKLRGNLSSTGGELTATHYTDTKCKEGAERETYTVLSYSEDGDGSFTIMAEDELGVVSITSGLHQFVEKKKGGGKN